MNDPTILLAKLPASVFPALSPALHTKRLAPMHAWQQLMAIGLLSLLAGCQPRPASTAAPGALGQATAPTAPAATAAAMASTPAPAAGVLTSAAIPLSAGNGFQPQAPGTHITSAAPPAATGESAPPAWQPAFSGAGPPNAAVPPNAAGPQLASLTAQQAPRITGIEQNVEQNVEQNQQPAAPRQAEQLLTPAPFERPPPATLSLMGAIETSLAQNPDLVALRRNEGVGVGVLGVAKTYP
ncbi:MAG TPA: hypothetical protein VHY20_08925, partial [Pirellulales bacterium]|nr:hypothetical protein [Pirellulales bacterium]